jgi:hypothetical protein
MENNQELQPGSQVAHPETGEVGHLLGPFTRKGKKWWTIFWKEAGTHAIPESEIQ